LYIGTALACTVINFQIVVASCSEVKYAQVLLSLIVHSDVLGRMLPVLTLVVPTVMFGLLRYLFTVMVRGMISHIMHFSHRHEQEKQVRFITLLYQHLFKVLLLMSVTLAYLYLCAWEFWSVDM
jgi:hypothetical protein